MCYAGPGSFFGTIGQSGIKKHAWVMESQLLCPCLIPLWVVNIEVAALCQSLCRVLSAPTLSVDIPLAPGVWLTMFKASSDTHRSVSLNHTAVRKSCEVPPWEQHPFAWEMQWGSVPCSRSLPELCCRSALPGHVPCWTSPNPLVWVSGMALNLPHFYRPLWKSLHIFLTLIISPDLLCSCSGAVGLSLCWWGCCPSSACCRLLSWLALPRRAAWSCSSLTT